MTRVLVLWESEREKQRNDKDRDNSSLFEFLFPYEICHIFNDISHLFLTFATEAPNIKMRLSLMLCFIFTLSALIRVTFHFQSEHEAPVIF